MTEDKAKSLAVVGEEKSEGEKPDYSEARREILALRDKVDDAVWDLAVMLVDVYDKAKYHEWGYGSWREYVEKELDWHIRKGQTMVQLQKWFNDIPANIQDWIRSLGWGKAKILQRVVTTENAAEWRNKIEGKTLAEIEEILKGERDAGGGGTGESPDASVARSMSFKLFPDQYNNVEMAIEKAKDMAESDKPGHCLDLIATEFMSTNAGIHNIKDYLLHIEKSIGFRLLAFDKVANEVVYGGDLLDELDAEAAEAEGDGEDGSEPEESEESEETGESGESE